MKKAQDGRFWNSRPAGPGATEFHVGWVNYLDADDRWRPIDCALAPVPGGGFRTEEAPFRFAAPAFADHAAYLESNCRYDIFSKTKIDAPPLGKYLTALDAAHVPGRMFDLGGGGRPDAVLYEGALPQWGADLIYYVRHGRAPRLEKLIRFVGPPPGDVAARFAIAYTGGVEISPKRIDGARRTAHWDRRGRLSHRKGFYVRAQGEPQKRGIGIRTPKLWDSNADIPQMREIEATFEDNGAGLILTKHVPADFFRPDTVYPVYTDTTSTFYPDPDPETTCIDGLVRTGNVNQSFSAARADAGDEVFDTLTTDRVEIEATGVSNNFRYFGRTHILFDTSSLPDTAVIDNATLSLRGMDVVTSLEADEVAIVSGSPASDTEILATDFALSHFGTTEFASRISTAAWSTSAYNDFALNASGLAQISRTGLSRFGFRLGLDLDNEAPTWAGGNPGVRLRWYSADQTGTTLDPKLVVEHSLPAVVVQRSGRYAVRTPQAALSTGANYVLSGVGNIATKSAQYAVATPVAAITAGLEYRLPKPVALKTLRYEITGPTLSGVIKDRRGATIDCATYNVRINVYPAGNTSNPPVATRLVAASNGAWTINSGLTSLTKYLVTFEYEGVYTPLGDADIADAAFMTATL